MSVVTIPTPGASTSSGLPPFYTNLSKLDFFGRDNLTAGTRNLRASDRTLGFLASSFGRRLYVTVPGNEARRKELDEINRWRNAIAHQNFLEVSPGAKPRLTNAHVRRWRSVCKGLARSFDEVMRIKSNSWTALTKRGKLYKGVKAVGAVAYTTGTWEGERDRDENHATVTAFVKCDENMCDPQFHLPGRP
jgi:hypothetical protein